MVEAAEELGTIEANGAAVKLDNFRHCVDQIFTQVDTLEKRVDEVERFHTITCEMQHRDPKCCSVKKAKDKDKHIPSIKRQRQQAAHREAAAAKRMQELMRYFSTILRQITQHKWAWPFMQPVDVKGLGLHDYFEIIDRPMDFSTIKNQIEAKDDIGYKNVRDVYADVRLIFDNAMKYNDEQSDVYAMAKTLLAKFEEKWLQLLPKVIEERIGAEDKAEKFFQNPRPQKHEKRRKEDEVEAQLDIQLAQEVARAKMARDLSNELYEVDARLGEIKELLVQKCRKISLEEKRKLGAALTQLSPENLSKALEIVTQDNPSFHASAEEVNLDIDAQRESTLWRLIFFVKDVLELDDDESVSMDGVKDNNRTRGITACSKRKKEFCDDITKNAKKLSK